MLLDQGGRFERFRVARFSFQSRSLLGRLCAHIRVHDPRILETSIFFLADYVLHARSVSVSARQKAAKSEERVWPFFSPLLHLLLLFLGCVAMRHAITTYQTSRGRQKKREKKATDRWRPGGWHSNVPPCLRRSTKDAGASEGNWKMTRRERERGTGTSLKGSTSGTNRWSRRRVEGDVRKDRERAKEEEWLLARGRREVVEEGGEERERERDGQRRGGRMVKARMKEREEPWSKKGTHKGPLVN